MIFPTWSEWIKIKESNARKRAVQAALNGTGPDLPASYAACPSTNPKAMKIAKKKGVVTNYFKENDGQKPDYSFDRWIQKTKEFGDDVNKMRINAIEDEEELDKKKVDIDKDSDKKDDKENSSKDKEEPETYKAPEGKEDVWKELLKKHKEKLKDLSKSSSST